MCLYQQSIFQLKQFKLNIQGLIMKATLHTPEQSIIDIDLPEANALRGARINIYSNIDHVVWEAQRGNITVQHISTTPTPGASLAALAESLRNAVAKSATVH